MNTLPQHTRNLPLVDIFRSPVDGSDRCAVEVQSCVCVWERERACECDHAFISHAVAYSVWQLRESRGPQGHPTGIKKALSVGCVSQWAAEPWGAALLITAGVVCQCRHMMHSAITVGGKDKTRSKIAATPATNLPPYHGSKTSYYSNDCCGSACQYGFVLSYPTCNLVCTCKEEAHSWSHGEDGIRSCVTC